MSRRAAGAGANGGGAATPAVVTSSASARNNGTGARSRTASILRGEPAVRLQMRRISPKRLREPALPDGDDAPPGQLDQLVRSEAEHRVRVAARRPDLLEVDQLGIDEGRERRARVA